MKHIYLIIASLIAITTVAQGGKKVFFIGNSYTNTNNIPELTKRIATAAGDQLTYTSHTPGGTTLQQHNNNQQVTNIISQGNWDYVVLQEQSQLPAFPEQDVVNQVYPNATALSNKIKQYNPCAKVTFYMTWGRKNGDTDNCGFWPPMCTYIGMDDLLQQRYTTMANANNGILAPVAAVWRYLIVNNPEINLYSADESHPSMAGSMASAYTFYSIFFEKTPNSSTFTNNLPAATITAIKNAVNQVVFNNLAHWKVYENDPVPDFNYTATNELIQFTNRSVNSQTYLWEFGDGAASTLENPSYTYNNNGNYTVKLTATKCNKSVVIEKLISITNLSTKKFLNDSTFLYPNPADNQIEFNSTLVIDTIEIIDSSGKSLLMRYSHTQDNYKVNIDQLASGHYYLRIKSNKERHLYSFIKK